VPDPHRPLSGYERPEDDRDQREHLPSRLVLYSQGLVKLDVCEQNNRERNALLLCAARGCVQRALCDATSAGMVAFHGESDLRLFDQRWTILLHVCARHVRQVHHIPSWALYHTAFRWQHKEEVMMARTI
jgi:hypothetical protein